MFEEYQVLTVRVGVGVAVRVWKLGGVEVRADMIRACARGDKITSRSGPKHYSVYYM